MIRHFSYLLILLLLSCTPQHQIPTSITLKSGPTAADRGGHTITIITRTEENCFILEGVEFRFISKETGEYTTVFDTLFTGSIPCSNLEDLSKTLTAQKFWSMKQSYRDPDILDGDYTAITITTPEEEKSVTVVNRSLKRFSRVKSAIREVLKRARENSRD